MKLVHCRVQTALLGYCIVQNVQRWTVINAVSFYSIFVSDSRQIELFFHVSRLTIWSVNSCPRKVRFGQVFWTKARERAPAVCVEYCDQHYPLNLSCAHLSTRFIFLFDTLINITVCLCYFIVCLFCFKQRMVWTSDTFAFFIVMRCWLFWMLRISRISI